MGRIRRPVGQLASRLAACASNGRSRERVRFKTVVKQTHVTDVRLHTDTVFIPFPNGRQRLNLTLQIEVPTSVDTHTHKRTNEITLCDGHMVKGCRI